ncbi:transcription antitermination factor NusB [Atopobium fossor]|uniref:transcription antitermination factor NusB n=1 Tax=Atopobium fossor TaxID=39487 RepID=UPI000428E56D|nr:transcription antitermination factor NusB [Atopobium fossor]
MSTPAYQTRRLARSQALQILFQAEATGRSVLDVLSGDYALSDGPLNPYAQTLALTVSDKIPALDGIISRFSKRWEVMRMPAVDRNLLRLTVCEMLCIDEVDIAVCINESVELARDYGTDESSRFINGVLGAIALAAQAGEDLFATTPELDVSVRSVKHTDSALEHAAQVSDEVEE